MNEKVLKTLEYYKIIKMLENQAGSEPGKKLCHALVPSADIHEIKENQKQTFLDELSEIGTLPETEVSESTAETKIDVKVVCVETKK